ncbi:MAG: O-antigen ligase family protein [Acidobacteria bacterium]|nr:O-antigen ligase family protein [Acidobacteriota bacterium]
MTAVLVVSSSQRRIRSYGVLVVLCALVLFCASDYGQSRLASLRSTPALSEVTVLGAVPNSFAWRLYHWKLLVAEWAERPLLGYGLHTSGSRVSPWGADAHNDYLRYLVETGVVGSLFYLALLGSVGTSLYRRVRGRRPAGTDRGLAFVAFSVFCAWLVGSLAGNFITATSFQYGFWALLGVVLGLPEEGEASTAARGRRPPGSRAETEKRVPAERDPRLPP